MNNIFFFKSSFVSLFHNKESMYVEKLNSIVILFEHVVGCKHLLQKKSLLRQFEQ